MKLVALSGKKQSGKSTTADFLKEYILYGWDRQLMSLQLYSFADLLKQHICIDILGLKHEQCYGTDAEKDSLTEYRWEDMPVPRKIFNIVYNSSSDLIASEQETKLVRLFLSNKGFMTGRQIMQFVGTDIFRAMCPKIWSRGTINKIKKDNIDLAIITDCRFPDEVEATQEAGGKVIRLMRNVFNDQHSSETALDDYVGFDGIVYNQDLTLEQKNNTVLQQLKVWHYC